MTNTAYRSVKAFLNNEKISLGNTKTDGSNLYLHGNMIAHKENNNIIISLCGWNSHTTKDRLNELLSQTRSDLRIRSKDYTPYLIKYGHDNDNNYKVIDSLKIDSNDSINLSEVLLND